MSIRDKMAARREARQAARELRKELKSDRDVKILTAIENHEGAADLVIAEIGEPPAGTSWAVWLIQNWDKVLRLALALLAFL